MTGLIIGQGVSLTGTTTGETGLYLEDIEIYGDAGGPGDLTLEGQGGAEGVHLGMSSYLVAGNDLTIAGTAVDGIGVSAGMGTEMSAGGALADIRGEVTSTGTGVAFEGVTVNQSFGQSSVSIVGTGGGASTDRGIEISESTIIGNGIALEGSASIGDAGIRLDGAQLFSNAGPVTMSGGNSSEGVRFEGYNVMYSEERPEVFGNVVFDQDSQFDLGISGHPDTATGQVLVNGTITVRPNAGLTLLPSYHHSFVPDEGQSYLIFGNDGTDSITGAFVGMAEGAAIPDFLGFGVGATVSYSGGDGNDMVISTQAANTPPSITPIGNQVTDEGALLSLMATGTDADLPAQELTFSLDAESLAKGMLIDAVTGAFSWTPGEAQSGNHTVTITLTDNGPGTLSDSATFIVLVNELNQAPILAETGNQTVDEGMVLEFAISATDADLPVQTLTFSLDAESLAKGMLIDPVTGAFSWTPAESHEGEHTVTVTVTDNGPGALTDSETFTITVNEVNQSPELDLIGNQNVDELVPLAFTVTASDGDLPVQVLSYSLDAISLSKGMTINTFTGEFFWTPTEPQSGSHAVTVTVTDNGAGNLTDSETFTITVDEVNQVPILDPIGNQSTDTASTLNFVVTATDTDLPSQTLTFSLDAASLARGMTVDANTGAFSWAPDFNDGGDHSVTVSVSDGFGGADSETFSISVAVLNQPPSLLLEPGFVTYTEDEAPSLLSPAGEVTDLEGNWNGGILRAWVSGGAVASDRLQISGGTATLIAGNYIQVGGTTVGRATSSAALGGAEFRITFNANATNAAVQAVVRALGFDSLSTTDPVAGTRTVTMEIWDGGGLGSGPAFRQVEVIAVNDPPQFADLGGSAAYLIGEGAVTLDQSATIIDEDRDAANGGQGDYSGATLTVRRLGGANPSDGFGFDVMERVSVSGSQLYAGGLAIAGFTSAGGELQIAFTDTWGGTPTGLLVDEILQAITYDNPGLAASDQVDIEFVFDDGGTENHLALGQVRVSAFDANSAGVSGDELIITTDGDGDAVLLSIADGFLRIRSEDDSIIGGAGTMTDANGDLYVDITGLKKIAFYLGASDDTISISDLTGFTGELIINGGDGQDKIDFSASLTPESDKNIQFSAEEVRLSGASLVTSGTGSIQIDSSGTGPDYFKGVSIVNSVLAATGTGGIEISGEAGRLGGVSQGVRLYGTSLSTAQGDIVISGKGGGTTSSNNGVVLEAGSSIEAAASGNVTIHGMGGAGGSSAGISLNSGSRIAVENGTLTLEGSGGTGTGNQNRGVNLGGATLSATGGGSINLLGQGGSVGSSNGGIYISGGQITTGGGGGISLRGTGSLVGTNDNTGVTLTGGTLVETVAGPLTIQGQGGGTGASNRGIEISGSSTQIRTASGAMILEGRGSSSSSGNYNEGILVQSASLSSSSGTISLSGTGGSGNSYNYGVRLYGASLSTTGVMALVGIGGNGTGIQNVGVWVYSGASVLGNVDSSITGTGGVGSSKSHGVYLTSGSTTIDPANIIGTAGSGTGSLNLTGSFF
ncbi:MAG: tandem-95 repeat protein [Verrucomicrobiae bacterium]|nr:tandem-95 repeat protein [Verrucomicrobiae bacterium]